MTLTKKQMAALREIVETPGKSGRFYRAGGHAPQTISSLIRLGLIWSKSDWGLSGPERRSCFPTDLGKVVANEQA